MKFPLLPDIQADALPDLTPERLQARGIRALLLDFDNTIVPYTTDVPAEPVVRWFAELERSGIAVCIVSNSRKDRVLRFCEARALPCVRRAGKPSARGLQEAMNLLHVQPAETAMAGDQIYTDVLAGSLAGVTTILVRPLALSNVFLKLRHIAEKPWILAAERRRLS